VQAWCYYGVWGTARNYNMSLTRNSSGDEIVNVNFLYDDIVHVLQNTRLVHKFRHRSTRWLCVRTYVYQIQ